MDGKYASVLWRCAILLLAMILLKLINEIFNPNDQVESQASVEGNHHQQPSSSSWCDMYYVVGEGETLYSISNKCGDPFIVERNPHIQDADDVFPGTVIKIDPHVVLATIPVLIYMEKQHLEEVLA